MKTKRRLTLALLAATVALAGCNEAENSTRTTTTSETALTGSVTKGPVNNASIVIYQMNADGSRGEQVAGPFTSGADGHWQGHIPAGMIGPFFVVANGGNYQDEATAATVELTEQDELISVIDPSGGELAVPVTPYTHAVTIAAQKMIEQGKHPSIATRYAAQLATLELGFNPTTILPPNPQAVPEDATTQQKLYAAMLGGLSRLAQDTDVQQAMPDVNAFKLARALSRDFADGKLDGKDLEGQPIRVTAGQSEMALPLLSNNWDKLLQNAQQFAAEHSEQYPDLELPQPDAGFYSSPIQKQFNDGALLSCDAINPKVIQRLNNGYLTEVEEYVRKSERLITVSDNLADNPDVIEYVGKNEKGKAKVNAGANQILLDPCFKDSTLPQCTDSSGNGNNHYYQRQITQDIYVSDDGRVYFANGRLVADDDGYGLCHYASAQHPEKKTYVLISANPVSFNENTNPDTETNGNTEGNTTGGTASGAFGGSTTSIPGGNTNGGNQPPTNTQRGAIGDRVWFDANQNGIQDSNEPGLPGKQVKLFDISGLEQLASTLTDSNGNYQFNELVPGQYRIQFIAPPEDSLTLANTSADERDSDANPATGMTDIISLQPGEQRRDIDAGLHPTQQVQVDQIN